MGSAVGRRQPPVEVRQPVGELVDLTKLSPARCRRRSATALARRRRAARGRGRARRIGLDSPHPARGPAHRRDHGGAAAADSTSTFAIGSASAAASASATTSTSAASATTSASATSASASTSAAASTSSSSAAGFIVRRRKRPSLPRAAAPHHPRAHHLAALRRRGCRHFLRRGLLHLHLHRAVHWRLAAVAAVSLRRRPPRPS